jgi:hypothetical protein
LLFVAFGRQKVRLELARNGSPAYEADGQSAKVLESPEPRILSWAGMKDVL